ncbi:ComEA family DNA-binding protein [Actinokineospora terrae]|uniref:Competence protein ComEA n=1 Tax=Actinokineospora terrae TaxID=155974 RepID=A0A1H9QYF7_9PSEU|nr:ComEA family DNA-binding protein [Actinokineospora terrae]SER65506.1 competence protein ComEA [Actinokineospora terrae]
MADEQRVKQIDSVLARLAAIAGRPWDRGESDTEQPRRRRFPVSVAIGLAVAAVAVVGVLAFSGSPPTGEPAPALAAAAVEQPPVATIVVDVVGKVREPGLRTLPDGARVDDALRAGGGALPGTDLTSLNLARKLVDGEQIHVGAPAPPVPEDVPEPGGKVNLNTATLARLDTLPGVGTVTAQRILDWRAKHGRFTKVDQLREVDGIGPARYETLRDLVVIR